MIVKNDKLAMMRKGWHGIELGKEMYIQYTFMLSYEIDDRSPHIGMPVEGSVIRAFMFIVKENNIVVSEYPWNVSQPDMTKDDWFIIEKI